MLKINKSPQSAGLCGGALSLSWAAAHESAARTILRSAAGIRGPAGGPADDGPPEALPPALTPDPPSWSHDAAIAGAGAGAGIIGSTVARRMSGASAGDEAAPAGAAIGEGETTGAVAGAAEGATTGGAAAAVGEGAEGDAAATVIERVFIWAVEHPWVFLETDESNAPDHWRVLVHNPVYVVTK